MTFQKEHEHKFIAVNKENIQGNILRRAQFRIVLVCQKCGESKIVIDTW